MKKSSRIKDFYKKSVEERLEILKHFGSLSDLHLKLLNEQRVRDSHVEKMSENVVSTFELPYSIATNFLINEKDYLIPMVTEESSVVAAACHAAKLARKFGGFFASSAQSLMIGQIYLTNVVDFDIASQIIEENKVAILKIVNQRDIALAEVGGGAVDLIMNRSTTYENHNCAIVNLIVDVKDAMGANIVNSMAEFIAQKLEKLVNAKVLMSIVSNLSPYRVVKSKAIWNSVELGKSLAEKIVQANDFAKYDIYRAVTHNKGIMNGIDAVAIATGNDFRAIESAAHGYAAINGVYKPLTEYFIDTTGNLVGTIELPISVGIVGGATNINPMAKLSIDLLGVKTSLELAQIMASVGLAQNFSALKALVGEGIHKGHMQLHSKNIAASAGIPSKFIDVVAEKMVDSNAISVADALKIFELITMKER